MTWLADHELAQLRHEVVELRREVEVSARFIERLSESVAELTENQAAQLARLEAIEALLSHQPNPDQATHLVMSLGGIMGATFGMSVDDTGATLTVAWADDKGDIVPAPTSADGGLDTVAWASLDASTCGIDSSSGLLSPQHAGGVDFTVTPLDDTGAPVPGVGVAQCHIDIAPGPPSTLLISLNGETPQPVPAPGA